MAIVDVAKIKYRKDGRVEIPKKLLKRFNYTIYHFLFTNHELIIDGGPGKSEYTTYNVKKRLIIRKTLLNSYGFKFNRIILTSEGDIRLTLF